MSECYDVRGARLITPSFLCMSDRRELLGMDAREGKTILYDVVDHGRDIRVLHDMPYAVERFQNALDVITKL